MDNQIKYLTEKQVSEITGRAVQTLRNDRFRRKGFPYCKISKSIRYSLKDIIDFMEKRKITTKDL